MQALEMQSIIGGRMQITENLWQVGGSGQTAPEDAGIYLVRFGAAAALIDAGCGNGTQRLFVNISEALQVNLAITHLFLTHCHFDHSGGAEAVRQRYGCKVVAHQLDAAYLEKGDSNVTAASWYGSRMQPLRIDHKIVSPKEAIQVGSGIITAYHCPGHSPGSLVFVADIDSQRVLFGQDIHGPLHPDLLSNRSDYLRSLQSLLELNADILCEGHFGIFRGHAAIRKFIESYLSSAS
jgi:glyoxylase-like metal-dependent hydrolase (beta-lactamase superfamily II)